MDQCVYSARVISQPDKTFVATCVYPLRDRWVLVNSNDVDHPSPHFRLTPAWKYEKGAPPSSVGCIASPNLSSAH